MDELSKKVADLEWYRRSHANTDEYVDREIAKVRAAERHRVATRASDAREGFDVSDTSS